MPTVVELLAAAARGDRRASADLLPVVYDELRKLAAARLASEPSGHTLQATALVHEAYMRLVGPEDAPKWDHSGHFFAAAAKAMRNVLIDHARGRQRDKRGGEWQRVELNDERKVTIRDPAQELILDEALERLAQEDPSAAAVASLHLLAEMSIAEAAECLGISRTTAYEHWTYARAWLTVALSDSAAPDEK